MTQDFQPIFDSISKLIQMHSPSGMEKEIDEHIISRFEALGHRVQRDAAGNIFVCIPGSGDGTLAITAHKDEIGAIVTHIKDDGRVLIRKLGGTFPWVFGEGVVDLLGEHQIVQGIMSFGSRHVSDATPNNAMKDRKPLTWSDVWVETKLSPEALEQAGVRPGTKMVMGKHRKEPLRLGDYMAGYALDNKASLHVLLELAASITNPVHTIYLAATSMEEPGAFGALFLAQRHHFDAMLALEIAPAAAEYPISEGPLPVLFAEDGMGLYDERLNNTLRHQAKSIGIDVQTAAFSSFGSDASISLKYGHIGRAACIGFPTQNTHGYEIAHLGAIENMQKIVEKAVTSALWD